MFISFEGIDFSGKTTQVQLLAKYLINKGFRVITLREPGGTEISEKIRQILLEPKNELTSITELFLFEAARSDVVRKVIKPNLEQGNVVICDRFWDSTIAYQGYGRQIPIDFIEKCNFFASDGLEPDITFLLDIDIEILKQRAKTNIFDRIESEGIEFLKRVANGFRVLAKQYNERILVIDGSNTIEDIHKKVVEIIENRLKGRDE
ncbi:dTMP kinase [Bacteroidetes/Chlorobi group bacterium Naka2016]|jgi:dTMP kinase|nr:MAG: dTMP kinase [Bacteroidetes/Chlorobi group bacterium Naka2016]